MGEGLAHYHSDRNPDEIRGGVEESLFFALYLVLNKIFLDAFVYALKRDPCATAKAKATRGRLRSG